MRKFFILCVAAAGLSAPLAHAATLNATVPQAAPGDTTYQLAKLNNEVGTLQMQVRSLNQQSPVQSDSAPDDEQLISAGG